MNRSACALVLASLFALSVPVSAMEKRVLRGFTAGGAQLVYDAEESTDFGGDYSGYTKTVVVDLATGQKTEYLFDEVAPAGPPAADDVVAAKQAVWKQNRKAFAAWLKAHPLKPAVAGRASPDGKSTAEVELKGNKGAWKGAVFEYFGVDDPTEVATSHGGTALLVGVGGRRHLVANAEWAGAKGHVEPSWSSDGSAVVFVVTNVASSAMAEPDIAIVAARPTALAIEVLTPKQLARGAGKVGDALEKAGFRVLSFGPAQDMRERSVLYVAKGFEEQAKAVAAAVPGGASIEPLSWKTNTDIVVAVGASALE